ncbi:MAG: gliding motility-associated C-terminal domain-containing protein, partial [Bacteroidales bacterium]|nr:gliding motility-associated C-terminal domain-containing protein [Bacteroidales bacterium]
IWSGNGIIDINSGVFNPAEAGEGNHTITYEFTGECGGSDDIVIIVNPSADATINPVGPFCEDEKPINLTAAQNGGAWSGNGITDASAGVFNPVFAGVGDHIVTYTISGACGDSDQITISIIEYFDASITSGLDLCYRDSTALLTAASVGGIWEGADVFVSGDETYLNMIDIGPGDYEIIYHYDGLCGDADTVSITIHPLVDATITPVDTLTDKDNLIQLEAAQDGGVWDGIFVDILGIFNPQEAGAAEHQVIYTIEGLCGDADTTKIIVIPAPISDLRVPTVITPDNDGYNDTWKVEGVEAYENVSINIFTRWGDEVFIYNGSGKNYANPLNQWDGRKNDKDLPTGSYVYILILDNTDTYKGTISLIR